MSDTVIRYPYLVMPPTSSSAEMASPSSSPSPSTLVGDIDMDSADATQNVHGQTKLCYIALDTNIFIYHLHLVQQVYRVLNAMSPVTHHLLVPFAVINELDKLKLSHDIAGSTPAGDVTTGDLAKAATRWLLDTIRATRTAGHGALRYQRWSEVLRQDRHKGDDQILDCCLYFKENRERSEVVLWTNDHNLSLLAETNDVQSVGGLTIRLESLLQMCAVSVPPGLLHELRLEAQQTTILDEAPDMDGMELDNDLNDSSLTSSSQQGLHNPLHLPLSSTSRDSLSLFPSQYDNSTWFPKSTLTASTQRPIRHTPSTTIPRHIYDRLTTILRPALTTIRPNTTHPTALPRLLQEMVDALLDAAKSMDGTGNTDTDTKIDLLRCISALRTILTFVNNDVQSRRPRVGQVAEDIQLLAGLLFRLGIIDAQEELRLIAQEIRELL